MSLELSGAFAFFSFLVILCNSTWMLTLGGPKRIPRVILIRRRYGYCMEECASLRNIVNQVRSMACRQLQLIQ